MKVNPLLKSSGVRKFPNKKKENYFFGPRNFNHENSIKKGWMVNPEIFRSYDIRGIYPTELNEKTAFKIGKIFVDYIKAKKVITGRDCRLSSLTLFRAIVKGITQGGADVYSIGEVPTECIYFSVGYYNFDGGIMITASHNPKEYNGFKMVKRGVDLIQGKEIKEVFEKLKFKKIKKMGKIKEIDIWRDYLRHIFSFVEIEKIKPLKIVIDASNGMAGRVIPLLEKNLPIRVIPLNFNLDGNFPAHSPNPLEKDATKEISKVILKEKADLGFLFDGDADRIFVIDELGNLIRGDITLLILAKHLLRKNPGAKIVYNLICSKAVPEFIRRWGGKPIRTAVGFVNVRKRLIEEEGIMGGEVSGHYCFRDNFYCDSAFVAFLILLEVISQSPQKISEMTKTFSVYAKTSEINFKVENKEEILNKIRESYSDGKQDFLDGITVEYNDWWFNLRPSQTEPTLRLVVEAKKEKIMKKKKRELSLLILKKRG